MVRRYPRDRLPVLGPLQGLASLDASEIDRQVLAKIANADSGGTSAIAIGHVAHGSTLQAMTVFMHQRYRRSDGRANESLRRMRLGGRGRNRRLPGAVRRRGGPGIRQCRGRWTTAP